MKTKVRLHATVAEMAGQNGVMSVDIPVTNVDFEELTKGDGDPLFVTLEAMSEGISANKMHYTKQTIAEIAAQINTKKPDGINGHIEPTRKQFDRPDPVTIWLGSKVVNVKGKERLFIKGYVLPHAKELKSYLRAAKAAGKNANVSIYAEIGVQYNDKLKAYDCVPGTVHLESIDWARTGAQGIKDNTGYMHLAAEMDGDINERESVIQTVTVAELQGINPELFVKMKEDIKKEVEATVEPEVRNKVVAEMKDDISKKDVEIARLNKVVVDSKIESELSAQPESARGIIKKMVIAEMAGSDYTFDNAKKAIDKVVQSEEVRTLISSIGVRDINGMDDNRQKGTDGRKFTTV